MRKVVLYIAMSLDGYIADRDGGVDWLSGQNQSADNQDSYSEFIKNVDTVIMGWNTYQQVTTELSPDSWPYAQQKTYVITHRQHKATNNIIFTAQNPGALLDMLQSQPGKDIWICGGAHLVQQLIKADLIDEYYISVIPTLLGSGIPLFTADAPEIKLKLICSQNYNGIVKLIYQRR